MIEGYLTINEVAEKWNVSARRVRTMCSNGQIEGVAKLGKAWAIPLSSEKPSDGIVTTGEYKVRRSGGCSENNRAVSGEAA